MSTKFGDVVLITYGEEKYFLMNFDTDENTVGSPVVGHVSVLPLVFFQLIDQGYSVMKDDDGRVMAYSPANHERMINTYSLVEKETHDGQ